MRGPWDEKWEIVQERYKQGGQSEVHIVKDKAGKYSKALLKVLKNRRKAKARSRMKREVDALELVSAADGKVPLVLGHNTEQFKSEGSKLYIVMEFIDGPTLTQLIKDKERLPIDDAVNAIRSICETVRISHGEDVLHRDLKPDNIIVRNNDLNANVILDFGIAFKPDDSDEEDLTEYDEQIRNAFFVLPELIARNGRKRDSRSDFTFICGLFYYLLTGTPPGQLRGEEGQASHRRPGFSTDEKLKGDNRSIFLNIFFDRGFQYEIENRFQSIEEFEDELRTVLSKSKDCEIDHKILSAMATRILKKRNPKYTTKELTQKCTNLRRDAVEYASEKEKELRKEDFELGSVNNDLDFPEGYTQLNLLPCRFRVKQKEFHSLYDFIYFFGEKDKKCQILRINGLKKVNPGKMIFTEPDLIYSFGRDDETDFSIIEHDINEQLSLAVRFLFEIIQGEKLEDS